MKKFLSQMNRKIRATPVWIKHTVTTGTKNTAALDAAEWLCAIVDLVKWLIFKE